MSDSTFYSDRVGQARPRVSEEVSANAWLGLLALIRARIHDGSLARVFPCRDCRDEQNRITGTDENMFLDSLLAHIPELEGRILEADVPRSTTAALDIVDFVALHIDRPSRRLSTTTSNMSTCFSETITPIRSEKRSQQVRPSSVTTSIGCSLGTGSLSPWVTICVFSVLDRLRHDR